jgi:hypothetical protein
MLADFTHPDLGAIAVRAAMERAFGLPLPRPRADTGRIRLRHWAAPLRVGLLPRIEMDTAFCRGMWTM